MCTESLPLFLSLPSPILQGIRTHILLIGSKTLEQRASQPVQIVWISAGFSFLYQNINSFYLSRYLAIGVFSLSNYLYLLVLEYFSIIWLLLFIYIIFECYNGTWTQLPRCFPARCKVSQIFFVFLSHFVSVLVQNEFLSHFFEYIFSFFSAISCAYGFKVDTSANMNHKIFLLQNFNNGYHKTQNSMLISNP